MIILVISSPKIYFWTHLRFGREGIGHGLVHVVKSFSAKNFVFGRTVLLNFGIKIQGGQKKRKSLKTW